MVTGAEVRFRDVNPAARAQIEDDLAGLELRERRRIAAPQRGLDRSARE